MRPFLGSVSQCPLGGEDVDRRRAADLTALELRLIKRIVGTGIAGAAAVLAGLRLLLN